MYIYAAKMLQKINAENHMHKKVALATLSIRLKQQKIDRQQAISPPSGRESQKY